MNQCRQRIRVVYVVALAVATSGCASGPVLRSAPEPVTAAAAAEQPLDVTFFVTADTEIGIGARSMTSTKAVNHVRAMNTLTSSTPYGRALWPAGTSGAGTRIKDPLAVFVAGDLATDKVHSAADVLKLLRELYFATPQHRTERSLQFPVYPGAGNHDWASHGEWYSQAANDANKGIAGDIRQLLAEAASVFDPGWSSQLSSSFPQHYAIRPGNDRLLVVQLNTSVAEPCRQARLRLAEPWWDQGTYYEPSSGDCPVFDWLARTLADHAAAFGERAPVILVQHYGYDGFGLDASDGGYRGYWWHPDEREKLQQIIRPYNVIALFHGHNHGMGRTDAGTVTSGQPVFTKEISSGLLDPGYHEGRAWIDVDGDGKADFCRVVEGNRGNGRIRCILATSEGFGREITSGEIDVGFFEGRGWADVDGDGRADYCRVVEGNTSSGKLQCTLSTGAGFGATISSDVIDPGYFEGRSWVDVDGDGRADYCRVIERNSGQGRVRCTLSTGKGFGPEITSGAIEVGYFEGRGWADFDGDGRADYCRVVERNADGGKLRCTLSDGSGFRATEITSIALDPGFHEGRGWADVNRDGRADYCRIVHYNVAIGGIACILSDGTAFGREIAVSGSRTTGGGADPGYFEGRSWADFDGDGRADYCRVLRSNTGEGRVACTVSTGNEFSHTVVSNPVDVGYFQGRAFADVDGDGRADYCRVVVGNEREGRVRCTLSGTAATTVPVTAYNVPTGYCTGDVGGWVGGFAVVRVTDTALDVVYMLKPVDPDDPTKCAGTAYTGETTVGPVYSQPITTR
jgi:hypothetical protein